MVAGERRSFFLREFEPEDFEAMVALDRDCFEPGIAYLPYEMSHFLRLASREVVLAQGEETIAGFCIGHRSPRSVGRIITLDVARGFRRSGVGSALLDEVIRRLSRAGAKRTILEVDVRNAGAVAFYERFGFERTATIPNYYGPGLSALEMARPARLTADS
jgi:ribosomal-protein-alanine N-acetyltransferase